MASPNQLQPSSKRLCSLPGREPFPNLPPPGRVSGVTGFLGACVGGFSFGWLRVVHAASVFFLAEIVFTNACELSFLFRKRSERRLAWSV